MLHKDIDNLKELLRYANPWDKLRTNLKCGVDSKEMIDSAKRIIEALERSDNSDYTKLPSLIDVRDECLNDIPHEDYVIIVYNAIKKLGNFA
jgi:alpha-glucuronidase